MSDLKIIVHNKDIHFEILQIVGRLVVYQNPELNYQCIPVWNVMFHSLRSIVVSLSSMCHGRRVMRGGPATRPYWWSAVTIRLRPHCTSLWGTRYA